MHSKISLELVTSLKIFKVVEVFAVKSYRKFFNTINLPCKISHKILYLQVSLELTISPDFVKIFEHNARGEKSEIMMST